MQGHVARKRFGQNFLVDAHYIASILAAIAPRRGENIVEIGPGLGALTGALIAACGRLIAIEIDRDLAAKMSAEYGPDALSLHVADALSFDFSTLGPDLRVVGNLPYNISSPLLFHLAAFDATAPDTTPLLQPEPLQRMPAQPAPAAH